MSQQLMGSAEVGSRCGISRQRVHQITQRLDWPAPVAELAQGRVWLAEDVEAWIVVHRPRLGRIASVRQSCWRQGLLIDFVAVAQIRSNEER
jgi:prophage regulatory protein